MFFRELPFILSKEEKKTYLIIIAAIVLTSLLETAQISALAFYLSSIFEGFWDKGISFSIRLLGMPINLGFFEFSLSLLGLITIKMFVQLYTLKKVSKFPYEFFLNLSQKLFFHYLEQDYETTIKKNSAQLIKNCLSTCLQVAQGMLSSLQFVSYAVITTFLFFLLLFQYFYSAWSLILFFLSIGIFLIAKFGNKLRSLGKKKESASGQCYAFLADGFYALKEIKIYRKAYFFKDRFLKPLEEFSTSIFEAAFLSQRVSPLVEYASYFLLILSLTLAWSLGYSKETFPEALILLALIARRLLPAVNQLLSLNLTLKNAESSFVSLKKELLEVKKEKKEFHLDFNHEITLKDISYSYNGHNYALNNLSCTFKKGTYVAIIGKTGSGKSTLLDLLCGLIKPSLGEITVDGIPFRDLKALQPKIGYVPQHTAIIDDSLINNIAFGEPVDFKRIFEASRQAHLIHFTEKLKDGFDSKVGDKGVLLSGGERQRLSLARALYRNSEVLILDEASSALDTNTEDLIEAVLKSKAPHQTIFSVTHRLYNMERFDQIYLMEEGRIQNFGTHEELLNTSSLYQKLLGHKTFETNRS
ncbi:ABC transporter ATP-binding protein [Criblamydia sequanensis]|uniref:ABC-type transporter, ATPase subunit n=1 Tax=Candidatus Criblamydia sequanensis CRIB-18 TaxID=1437425 RepID=A0A090E0M8_9BACT|nr:ABC transporter ATP-binding protein [Criblamydia sequanensis]CDR34359.1 ABC-type transporter, ATPase subunit [Criblamydia sequanensis CRIB-18]